MKTLLAIVASLLAASVLVAGWHDASQAYDVWYYHVPFASRLVGLTNDASYALSPDNLARYQGFPLFGELLQGILWRITGHVEATNLLSVFALFALPLFLWRTARVPAWLTLIALLAIPLVQIHATSSYVDLPANICATMLLLCVARALEQRPSPRFLAGCAALAAATVNMKFQLVPIASLAALALVVLALRKGEGWRPRALVIALALPVVFATPLKNAALYENPVWPVQLGHSLPYREAAYESAPVNLESSPRAVRFVRSILEIDNRPIASQRRWSLDQWTPPSEPGYRMGGFFGAYVVVNLVLFGWLARRKRQLLVLFGLVTVTAALVPQSHELRYYMHWMLVLVCLNLTLLAERFRVWAGLGALAFMGIVAWSTSGAYLYASGSKFQDLAAARVDQSLLVPGTRICIARAPFTFLYAPIFWHRDYSVQEAATEAECRN